MKFHPQPATPLPLELLSAGNLAKKLALLDISPFFSFLLLPPPLLSRREKTMSLDERVLFSAVFLNVVNVSRFASDSAFRVFLASNASRVLFNHDNGVLSTLELGCFNYLLQLFYVIVNSRS